MWKTALIGALLTASIQAGPISPLRTDMTLGDHVAPTQRMDSPPEIAAWKASDGVSSPAHTRESAAPPVLKQPKAAQTNDSLAASWWADRQNQAMSLLATGRRQLAWLWLAAAMVLSLILAFRYAALWLRLEGRATPEDTTLVQMMQHITRRTQRARIRLTQTNKVSSPMAVGLFRPEVVLPDQGIDALSHGALKSLLAHEAAHHHYRDPAWLLFAKFMEAAFFFQPLNQLARRRIQSLAEPRCDAWAARYTGAPLELARCLVTVAGWQGKTAPALAPAMAVRGSALSQRVANLVDADPGRCRFHLWHFIPAALLLVLITFLVPSFSHAVPTPLPSLEGSLALPTPAVPASRAEPITSVQTSLPAPPVRANIAPVFRDRRVEPIPANALSAAPAPAPVFSPEARPSITEAPSPVTKPAPAPEMGEEDEEEMEREEERYSDYQDEVEDQVEQWVEEQEEWLEGEAEILEDYIESQVERIETRLESPIYENLMERRAERIEDRIDEAEDKAEESIDALEDELDELTERLETRLEVARTFEDLDKFSGQAGNQIADWRRRAEKALKDVKTTFRRKARGAW